MPELPEVETVRRGLAPVIVGAHVSRAEIRRPDLRWPFPPRLAERLAGTGVTALRRRSKYLLADLSSGETLIWHLGMSGRVLISKPAARPAASPLGAFALDHPAPLVHDHVVLDFDSGVRVTFNDPRRFGSLDLAPTEAVDRHRLLAGLGPEPLGPAFDGSHLRAAFAGRRSSVKAGLLDQRLVAGLGNIYVCEALHRAGISPRRRAGRIAAPRLAALAGAVRAVLTEAIEAGGSSLRDHRRTDGELGYFQHSFRVYGREGRPCPTPGCGGTIVRVVQSGRSSFYCRSCQR